MICKFYACFLFPCLLVNHSAPAFTVALLATHDWSGKLSFLLPCLVSQQELLVQKLKRDKFEILGMNSITIRWFHSLTLYMYVN